MSDLFSVVVLCLVALATASAVVLLRRPVHAAVALLGHSLALAGLYFTLAADFVAVGQVVVYAGAIVVLFLFVVALLPAGGLDESPGVRGVVAAAIIAVAILAAIASVIPAQDMVGPHEVTMNVADVGRALFGPLLVPFELTAPLLLAAIVGAVTFWRRQESSR